MFLVRTSLINVFLAFQMINNFELRSITSRRRRPGMLRDLTAIERECDMGIPSQSECPGAQA